MGLKQLVMLGLQVSIVCTVFGYGLKRRLRLAVGHVLGGPGRETSLVLGMSCAYWHPAVAFAIASSNFPDQRFGGAIIRWTGAGAVVVSLVVALACAPKTAGRQTDIMEQSRKV